MKCSNMRSAGGYPEPPADLVLLQQELSQMPSTPSKSAARRRAFTWLRSERRLHRRRCGDRTRARGRPSSESRLRHPRGCSPRPAPSRPRRCREWQPGAGIRAACRTSAARAGAGEAKVPPASSSGVSLLSRVRAARSAMSCESWASVLSPASRTTGVSRPRSVSTAMLMFSVAG